MEFGYARISKDDQALECQIDALNVYGVDEIYEETITEPRQDRQQLKELLETLRAGDTLVIGRLNQLGRTVKQFFALIKDFEQKGIRLVSLYEKFDTSNAVGKAVYGVFCSLAQMELEVISQRTKAGMILAKRRGRLSGRKPKENTKIESALKMYFSSESSIDEIIETTGLSKTTIYKYVREYKSKYKVRSLEDGKTE